MSQPNMPLTQRKKFKQWLDSADDVIVANAMLLITSRTINMLKSQLASQGRAFEVNGGFRERLMSKRIARRDKTSKQPPLCPECGNIMRQRQSTKGDFWGCPAYPECRGTRSM